MRRIEFWIREEEYEKYLSVDTRNSETTLDQMGKTRAAELLSANYLMFRAQDTADAIIEAVRKAVEVVKAAEYTPKPPAKIYERGRH